MIFSERLFKAILHELGHAFGLNHCSNTASQWGIHYFWRGN
ncbi:MAG TPA: hypothetical protein EYP08_00895 [Pyrodictiaceae archaeon]|nr:hypothetical protein [Pyrodictiaceae archaeon]